MRARAEARHVQRERQQGRGKPIISAEVAGQRLVAVKNRLLYSQKWKTFEDFLFDYIKIAIGTDWGNAEIAKPLGGRHPILAWHHKLCQYQRTFIKIPCRVNSFPMLGVVAAYLHLAYDVLSQEQIREFGKADHARLAQISVAHLYNLRRKRARTLAIWTELRKQWDTRRGGSAAEQSRQRWKPPCQLPSSIDTSDPSFKSDPIKIGAT